MLKRILSLVGVLMIVSLTFTSAAQSNGLAVVRFVHLLQGGPAIDVYIGETLAYGNLSYSDASPHLPVPVGDSQIRVTAADDAEPLWEQSFTAREASAASLIVSSDDPLEFTVFQDDLIALPLGRSRLTAIHAIPGVGAVDVVLADGRRIIPNLEYNQRYGTLDVPSESYGFVVTPEGGSVADALIEETPFSLSTGTSFVVVAYGSEAAPEALLLGAPTIAEDETYGYVRIVHAVPEAEAVDVYADDTLVVPALGFEGATDYLALPAGDYEITVTTTGTTDALVSADLTIEAGSISLVVASLAGDGVALNTFAGASGFAAYNESALTIVNLSTDSTVTTPNGELDDVESGSRSALIESGSDSPSIELDGVETNVNFDGLFGGVYYDVVVVDGAVIPLRPASIPLTATGATVITAAPGTDGLAGTTATPIIDVVQGTTPTADPNIALPTADPNIALTTATPPTPQILPPITVAPVTVAAPAITARVLLNPGANLHLRQYPNSEAFSLGLAPSGTVFIVQGREGAPEPSAIFTATPTPEDFIEPEPFVDPVTLLLEDEDLDPASTWLFVTYNTPDGGSITAWINALYVQVTNARGLLGALRDIPTVPGNRAGTLNGQAAGIAPTISPFRNVPVATIVGLTPEANLHLRRTPNANSESLALLPNGTQVIVTGRTGIGDWLRVEYQGQTGWISSLYVEVTFNEREYDIQQVPLDATSQPTPSATPTLGG